MLGLAVRVKKPDALDADAESSAETGDVEMSDDCEHNWMFAGTVYSYKPDPRPDGSVVDRIYEDHYYCTKCLQYRYTNVRKHGHSHTYPIAGSRPK